MTECDLCGRDGSGRCADEASCERHAGVMLRALAQYGWVLYSPEEAELEGMRRWREKRAEMAGDP